MADDVQLTDLEVIQRYSLAVRGATAERGELIAALQSDLEWLRGARSAPDTSSPPSASMRAAAVAAKPAAQRAGFVKAGSATASSTTAGSVRAGSAATRSRGA